MCSIVLFIFQFDGQRLSKSTLNEDFVVAQYLNSSFIIIDVVFDINSMVNNIREFCISCFNLNGL